MTSFVEVGEVFVNCVKVMFVVNIIFQPSGQKPVQSQQKSNALCSNSDGKYLLKVSKITLEKVLPAGSYFADFKQVLPTGDFSNS